MFEKTLCKMTNGDNVKKGDIVICSVNEGNFSEPCCLGVVIMVKNVTLGPGHNDGDTTMKQTRPDMCTENVPDTYEKHEC